MSIALAAKVEALTKRVGELEQNLGGMTRIELLAHIAQLELRLEALEQSKSDQKQGRRNG